MANENYAYSSSEVLYGTSLRLPGSIFTFQKNRTALAHTCRICVIL